MVRVERASHARAGGVDPRVEAMDLVVSRGARDEPIEDNLASVRAGYEEEDVGELGEGEIGAALDARSGPHGAAEAEAAGFEAVDADEERAMTASAVAGLRSRSLGEDAVLNVDGREVAGADAE